MSKINIFAASGSDLKGERQQGDLVQERLLRGSQAYLRALTGENGRFRMLHIEDAILPHPKSNDKVNENKKGKRVPQPVNIGDNEDGTGQRETVITMLPKLWKRKSRHTVITGEGGMGKTVSSVRLWQELLETANNQKLLQGVQGGGFHEKSHPGNSPIPLFIQLNEFNHRKADAGEFILSQITRDYLDDDMTVKNSLLKIFKNPVQTSEGETIPAVVLLLDGFNEVTAEKRELLLEINRLTEQCDSLQVVMTSRYDMRSNFNWSHWNLVQLEPLDDGSVEEYLTRRGMAVPTQERLKSLIRNPMMLTLYAASCEVQETYKKSSYCHFKERVETPGELLWNFMEAQVARLSDRVAYDPEKIAYYRFLLIYLLPALGFEMEKARLFDFTPEQVQEYLLKWCSIFGQDGFLDAFPHIGKYEKAIPVGDCQTGTERRERIAELLDVFCTELHMLVEESNSYRFLHQNFRDFFAALHILNQVEWAIKRKEVPSVLTERALSFYVRRFIGEVEGEHYAKPYLKEGEGWKIDIDKENRLHRMIDLCRGQFGQPAAMAVWNIVETWKEARVELTGADLSRLDLSKLTLNWVQCSRLYQYKYLTADFTRSRVYERNLFPQGHTDSVWNVVYSPDGKKILSASKDKTIIEWDAETGVKIRAFVGHKSTVSSAVYSRDEKKILSASQDWTIKEWDTATGKCVKTLEGNNYFVTNAVYSPDEKKILSAHWNNTINEWDVETGTCVKTLRGHIRRVLSAVYSRDGKLILSVSDDQTIMEWDAETGEKIRTLEGHKGTVFSAVYSPDGKRILSASGDKTIMEWDAETGKKIRTLKGHTGSVKSALYSQDGKHILSASGDKTIMEWDAETGKKIRTLAGHTDYVFNAVYSPDGKHILSASGDQSIIEWNAETGEKIQALVGHTAYVYSSVFSPDWKHILFALNDHTIMEWDAETGEKTRILAGHSSKVNSAVYSRDGKYLLSASDDHTIILWDAETGEKIKTLAGHTNPVISAVYSPDGKRILSASEDHTIIEWNGETGEIIKTLVGHTNRVSSAVYSRDGKTILSESWDDTFKIWDAITGQCLQTYSRKNPPSFKNYLTKDIVNLKLIYQGNKIHVRNASTKKRMTFINIPGLWIQGCSFKDLESKKKWLRKSLEILKQNGGKM